MIPETAQNVREFIYGVGVRYEMGNDPTDPEMTAMRVLIWRLVDLMQLREDENS
jgi:hypothetical protein